MHKISYIFSLILFLSGCAGPNPNPGERTTDMSWNSGDYSRAFELVLPSAEAGEPWAQLRLGIFYANGWGTELDLDKAEFWYKKAVLQKATNDWAEGILVGATGKPGYFNQNSDARIAAYNLAQLYYENDKNLPEAYQLINNVIEESEGKAIFFCCEFAGGRSFSQEQFKDLKSKIEKKMNGQ